MDSGREIKIAGLGIDSDEDEEVDRNNDQSTNTKAQNLNPSQIQGASDAQNDMSIGLRPSDRVGTDADLKQADRSMEIPSKGQLDLFGKKVSPNQGYEQFDISDNLDTRSEKAYTNHEKRSDYQFNESRRMETNDNAAGLALSARQLSEGSDQRAGAG